MHVWRATLHELWSLLHRNGYIWHEVEVELLWSLLDPPEAKIMLACYSRVLPIRVPEPF